jgi:hypothetical protein
MNTAIDLILILILLICAWSGYKKGLIMGIGGILVIIISIYGANLLSNTYSYEVIDALRPFASGYMEKNINEKVRPSLGMEEGELSVSDYLKENPDETEEFGIRSYESVGIYGRSANIMAKEAEEHAAEQNVSFIDAAIEVLCIRISYVIGFILVFLLILIVLTVIGNLPNLSYKIPNLELVNDIGGAVCGVITGFAFCCLLVWAMKFTGILLSQEILAETHLASWMMRWDIMGRILGI